MPEPWRVAATRVTFEDRWLKVRSDRCVTPAGHVVDPYHVLEYPTWVNVVALTAEGDLLLVREYRHGAGAVLVGLPCGAVEPADADPEAAARRELLEETGAVADEVVCLGWTYANPANHTNAVRSFLAIGTRARHPQRLDPNEDVQLVRAGLVDLLRGIHEGTLPFQGLHLAALHLAMAHVLASDRADLAAPREALRAYLLGRPC